MCINKNMPQLSSATSKCIPCIDLSQGPPGKKSGGISLLFKEIGKIRASYPIIYSKKFKPPGWCTPLLVVLIDLNDKRWNSVNFTYCWPYCQHDPLHLQNQWYFSRILTYCTYRIKYTHVKLVQDITTWTMLVYLWKILPNTMGSILDQIYYHTQQTYAARIFPAGHRVRLMQEIKFDVGLGNWGIFLLIHVHYHM